MSTKTTQHKVLCNGCDDCKSLRLGELVVNDMINTLKQEIGRYAQIKIKIFLERRKLEGEYDYDKVKDSDCLKIMRELNELRILSTGEPFWDLSNRRNWQFEIQNFRGWMIWRWRDKHGNKWSLKDE